jgi:hypothetical protein
MFKHTIAITILASSLLTTGCSDTDARLTATGPSALQLTSSAAPFAGISPTSTIAQLIGDIAGCPTIQPMRVGVDLTVHGRRDVDLFLTEVRMQFFDTTGLQAPQVTLPAPQLTRQFGTALIAARSLRTFPLDFRFGCGTRRTGTLIVFVQARDGHGRDDSAEIRVAVR